MTAELRWIFLLLHFTAAAAGINISYVTVRDGDDVTLPCYAGTGDQRCDGTNWYFSASRNSSYVTYVTGGKVHADVRSKSDRLRVGVKCSLVIKKVSVDDAGLYDCRQFDTSGRHQAEDAQVLLSVVTMSEQKVGGDDEVTLTCSVKTYDEQCRKSVQWLFEDKTMETSQFPCSGSVKIKTSEFNQKMKSLRCKVTDRYGNTEKLFEFKTQTSTATTAITAATTTTTTTSAVDPTTKTNMMTSEGTNNKKSTTDTKGVWWVYLLVGVASAVLVVVVVLLLIRQKKKKTSEIEPETDQNQADPEGVTYVSVSFTKTTRTRDQVKGLVDDEVTTAIYSTIKAPLLSSSSDARNLYTIINKLKRRRMVQ